MKPSLAAALTALALLSAPGLARADGAPTGAGAGAAPSTSKTPWDPDPGEAPEVRYPPPLVRLKVIAAGFVVTGLAWGVSFACASIWPYVPNPAPGAESGPPGSGQLKIPVVGPWIALGHSGCAPDEPFCGAAKVGVRDALLVIDGIVQAAGVALMLEGVIMKTSPERKKKSLALEVGGVEMTPAPLLTPTMQGMGLRGTF
jgi:hypothetical protein